jgi:hypothetical protein
LTCDLDLKSDIDEVQIASPFLLSSARCNDKPFLALSLPIAERRCARTQPHPSPLTATTATACSESTTLSGNITTSPLYITSAILPDFSTCSLHLPDYIFFAPRESVGDASCACCHGHETVNGSWRGDFYAQGPEYVG